MGPFFGNFLTFLNNYSGLSETKSSVEETSGENFCAESNFFDLAAFCFCIASGAKLSFASVSITNVEMTRKVYRVCLKDGFDLFSFRCEMKNYLLIHYSQFALVLSGQCLASVLKSTYFFTLRN